MEDRRLTTLPAATRSASLVGVQAAPALTLARCAMCGSTGDIELCVRCGKVVCPRCRGSYDDSYLNMGDQKGRACAPCLDSGEVHEAGPLRRFGRIANQAQRWVNGLQFDGETLAVGIRTEIRDVLVPEVRELTTQARKLVRDGLWGTTDRIGWWGIVISLLWLVFG